MKSLRGSHRFMKQVALIRFFIFSFIVCLCFSGLTGFTIAHAAGKKDIVTHKLTVVTQQEHVENVVVVGNDAEILGTVNDTVVIINGNVHVGPNAHIGLLIGIGGNLVWDPGAQIHEMYMVSLGSRFQSSLAVGSAVLLAASAIRLMVSVCLVVIPALLALFMRTLLKKPLAYLENSARRMALIGLLATICFAALVLAIAFTVVGIPIAIVLAILFLVLEAFGLAVTSIWIGHLAAPRILPEKPIWIYGWIGAIFIMAFFNIPLIGPLLLLLVSIIGIGSVIIWMWDGFLTRRVQKQ